jgi:hypothetical protein
MFITQVFTFLSLSLFFLIQLASAQVVPFDYDNNGLQDLGFVKINSDSSLSWLAFDPSSKVLTDLGKLGVNGNHLAPASWTSPTKIDLGVTELVAEQVNWKIQTGDQNKTVSDLSFGANNSLVIAGADFNGNSLGDFAVVRSTNKKLVFEVNFDRPSVGAAAQTVSSTIGRSSDKIFYASLDGSKDLAGVLRTKQKRPSTTGRASYSIILLDLVEGKKTRLKIGRFARLTKELVPIKSTSGSDNLLAVGDNKLKIFNLEGKVVYKTSRVSGDTVLVGDFLNDAGEEIALVNTDLGSVTIVNPISNNTFSHSGTEISGVPFDLVNLNQFGNLTSVAQSCSEIKSPNDGGGGFVWKDSDFHSGMVLLTPASYNFDKVEIYFGDERLSNLTYVGRHNENRQHWRDYTRDIAEYPKRSLVVGTTSSGERSCWLIENTAVRND